MPKNAAGTTGRRAGAATGAPAVFFAGIAGSMFMARSPVPERDNS
jgi:hypothetical protein